MSKAFGNGDTVVVNFVDRVVHGRVVGIKSGVLQVDLSPVGGILPMFADDGQSHEKDLHACYYTDDDGDEPVVPMKVENFQPTKPTTRVPEVTQESHKSNA